MEVSEDIQSAKDVIQALLKAKKGLRMYPSNNPIYQKTLEVTFNSLDKYFEDHSELKLKIRQNEIYVDDESIYQGVGKDDNLALFFFKDGLRELTINRAIDIDEFHEFLKILTYDFDAEDVDDDIVTLLWEKDLQNIRYVVDEDFLSEDENYEESAVSSAKEQSTDENDLRQAYEEAFKIEDASEVAVVPINDKDLNSLVSELQKDAYDKMDKLIEILFDIIHHADTQNEFKDMVSILNSTLEYSINNSDIASANDLLKKTLTLYRSNSLNDWAKRALSIVFYFASSKDIIQAIGRYLDSGQDIDREQFLTFVRFLTKASIPHFMTILGELKSIEARKNVISALTYLGSKDIATLAKGLNDSRWYVVRNIIYIFRQIGDKRVIEYLIRASRYNDVRVRKEAIRTLGELGGQNVINTIRDFLDDPDSTVRTTAIMALGNIGTDASRKFIMDRLTSKKFIDLDFNEKKDYFKVLSRWNDNKVIEFLIKTLKRRSLFKKIKNDENRACAAYCLGLIQNKDALAILHKMRDSKNKLLSEYAYTAIKRIEYGK